MATDIVELEAPTYVNFASGYGRVAITHPGRVFNRWRAVYSSPESIDTETFHFTKQGARRHALRWLQDHMWDERHAEAKRIEQQCYVLAHWLVALDDPDNPERQTVTLTDIIQRARDALTMTPNDP